jgi:hypothetical protein
MATLASTTRLRTIFKLLPSYEDHITKSDVTFHKPLSKGFHPCDEGTTLCEFFLGYLFLFGHVSLLHQHCDGSPIGEMYPFF